MPELSREMKETNTARIGQITVADQRQKGLTGFLHPNLDDRLRPIMPGQQSGVAARERLKDFKSAFMRALRKRRKQTIQAASVGILLGQPVKHAEHGLG